MNYPVTPTTMAPGVKEKWAQALESGEYKRGYKYLCRRLKLKGYGAYEEVFDPEGVLCQLAENAKAVAPGLWTGTDTRVKSWDGERGVLPWSVRDWAGMVGLQPLLQL